ncbi:DNA/RNA non-specific endonuclease [Oscillibacter sp. MSJ-2]|uniref:DNA/RNA non-specific endonuclease n=1 Tax=Dysosmobacter acutus TaxID=2841504 RepID=A0ABS6F6J7_9FIRM|nr:DNA/RNA non-specific endonuclease [Dysosmobacter acutus]MBU5625670.1 DNA/RNA non-specific endonuclease [Dysosmobacter acutus]
MKQKLLPVFLALLVLAGCAPQPRELSFSLGDIPEFSGEPYVLLNDNEPEFTAEEITSDSFETYGELDALGRCGPAFACVGADLMPTEERGSIGSVKPSGWQTVKYDCVDGKYLYNRCHLIGYQLTGENANEQNLITGTRYMNVDGMLPFENLVADYVKETEHHVLYRVTPIFEGEDLVARGVQMEGWSVEDSGDGVCFNVYVYNCQPGVDIDYATGESCPEEQGGGGAADVSYILNTSSHKFHNPDCSGVSSMNKSNKQTYTGSREALIAQGYTPCGQCNP